MQYLVRCENKALGSTVIGKKGQPVTRATSLQTTYPAGAYRYNTFSAERFNTVSMKVSRIITDAKPNIATMSNYVRYTERYSTNR